MSDLDNLARLASQVVFVCLGVLSLRHARRRDPAAMWMAATFCTLAAVTVAGAFTPENAYVRKALVDVLLLFPYLLWRFTATLRPAPRSAHRLAAAATAAIALWTVLIRIPDPGEARSAPFRVYLFAVLAYWTALSLAVAVHLWRAGRGQPTVARRRMRMLSAGSLALNVALLVAGAAPSRPGSVLAVLVHVVAIASGILFYLGFAPPRILRLVWRSHEQNTLRRAEAGLMSAMTAGELGNALLPHVAGILGGDGAAILGRDGRVLASYQVDIARVTPPPDGDTLKDGLATVAFGSGTLVVQASPYAPYFGREELDLLTSIGVLADLAVQRIQLVQRERRARTQAQRLNAELETFTYSVSHDLKSPLIAMLGYLDYLRTGYEDRLDDEGRHYVRRIQASATYMQQLIDDLLELSRIGRTEAASESVNLATLIPELAENLRLRHPAVTVRANGLPCVSMSATRARQLFSNLLENAARHGGRPDLHVAVTADRDADGALSIAVSDDGVGVPAAYREKVFGLFERLARPDGPSGTGIGLAVCRRIVEHYGGSIRLDDSPAGARVHVRLPVEAS